MAAAIEAAIPNKSDTTENLPNFDVVVIGGGMAGGVAAIRLAHAGLKVALYDKEKEAHHKVCGEFLSGEGIQFLDDIGIDVRRLGAVPVTSFRLHGPKTSSEAVLPFAAVGISRKVLDEEILRVAANAGVEIFRGMLVKEIHSSEFSHSGRHIVATPMGLILAKALVIATGKTEFRSLKKRIGRDRGLVGFKMHLRLTPSLAIKLGEHCDLFVFKIWLRRAPAC